jgi:Lyzozyme M1 (1,4-beta-N-acetylmuramidase)
MNGIDISKHNLVVDWGKVDDSIDFVLIRAGYGNDISQKDPKFDEYIKAALAHNLHVGVYWFSYAISVEDAKKEAEVCKKVIAPYKGKIDFPVAFDYEYASINWAKDHGIKVTDSIDSMARAFMDSMKSDGWFVNLYTNIDFIKSGRFSASTIKTYDVWLADYSGAPDYPCYIQQTSSTGTVPGITGNVDMDISFRDYPTMIKAGGYNGYPKQPQTSVKIDTTMEVSFAFGKTYTFYTESGQVPTVTCGTADVVSLMHCRRDLQRDYWHITFIGKPGQATGIYTAAPGEQPTKRFVARVA